LLALLKSWLLLEFRSVVSAILVGLFIRVVHARASVLTLLPAVLEVVQNVLELLLIVAIAHVEIRLIAWTRGLLPDLGALDLFAHDARQEELLAPDEARVVYGPLVRTVCRQPVKPVEVELSLKGRESCLVEVDRQDGSDEFFSVVNLEGPPMGLPSDDRCPVAPLLCLQFHAF